MKILFIGDSLIRGSVGVNWVKRLAIKNPGWNVESEGVNGDTLLKVKQRLDKKLRVSTDYDIIFFGAGINDLLIPVLSKKGFLFRQAQKYLLAQRSNPQNEPDAFETAFRQVIDDIKRKTNATIILTTLSCINESLESPVNQKRCGYNHIIRDVAIETGCSLVDAGALFDGYLRRCQTRDYLLENFFNTAFCDKFQCSVLGCSDDLSKKRKLHLTVDGLHVNSRGAKIYRDETEGLIKTLIATGIDKPQPRFQKSSNLLS
ncbi:MAG: SGNH/GDSL hydrolase family protein [Chitinophagaceae bacterium]